MLFQRHYIAYSPCFQELENHAKRNNWEELMQHDTELHGDYVPVNRFPSKWARVKRFVKKIAIPALIILVLGSLVVANEVHSSMLDGAFYGQDN